MELAVIHNPYRVKTILRIKVLSEWQDVSAESKLFWVSDKRLQRWIKPCRAWRGFFPELIEASGERDFKIHFTGTTEDYRDFVKEAESYSKEEQFAVTVMNDSASSQSSLTSVAKVKALHSWISEARASEFFNVLPDELKNFLIGLLTPPKREVIFWPALSADDKFLESFFAPNSREYVFFEIDEIHGNSIRTSLRRIASWLESVPDPDIERERIAFTFLCKDNPYNLGVISRFLLEQGLEGLPFYIIRHKGEQTPEIKNAMDTYINSFEDKIYLQKAIKHTSNLITKYSLNSSIRKSIETRSLSEREALSRLSEQLHSWNYESELNMFMNILQNSFRKKLASRYSEDFARLLKFCCEEATNMFETRCLKVLWDFIDEYLSEVPQTSSRWLPKNIGTQYKYELDNPDILFDDSRDIISVLEAMLNPKGVDSLSSENILCMKIPARLKVQLLTCLENTEEREIVRRGRIVFELFNISEAMMKSDTSSIENWLSNFTENLKPSIADLDEWDRNTLLLIIGSEYTRRHSEFAPIYCELARRLS